MKTADVKKPVREFAEPRAAWLARKVVVVMDRAGPPVSTREFIVRRRSRNACGDLADAKIRLAESSGEWRLAAVGGKRPIPWNAIIRFAPQIKLVMVKRDDLVISRTSPTPKIAQIFHFFDFEPKDSIAEPTSDPRRAAISSRIVAFSNHLYFLNCTSQRIVLGCRMKVKCQPEDFRVEELPLVPAGGPGRYTFYRLSKRSIGTIEAVEIIRRRWNLAARQVSYAGLKDRHAMTTQYLTIVDGPRRKMSRPGVRARAVGRLHDPYGPKHFRGNRFGLVVRDFRR